MGPVMKNVSFLNNQGDTIYEIIKIDHDLYFIHLKLF